MPKGVSPGQASAEQEDIDSSESEDDLTNVVDDVINNIFGATTYDSESDGDGSENLDDTSACEDNSDTDINTSDDNMEVDITWW